MSEASPRQRDDRDWPRRAFATSLVCGIASLAASAALVAHAAEVGRAADLVLVFVVMAVAQGVAWTGALNAWTRHRPVPRRARGQQAALGLLTLLAFAGGPTTGAAALCGCLVGIFLPSASVIRYARVNRLLRERGEPGLGEEGDTEGSPQDKGAASPSRSPNSLVVALREALTEDQDVWLAWTAATAAATLCFLAAKASAPTVAVVAMLGLLALTGVFQRLDRVAPAVRRLVHGAEERHGAEPQVARVSGVVSKEAPATIGWVLQFGWRFAGLVLVGLLVAWWD